ncbi:MAG: Anti-sigma-K factor RskA [uncultured Thiotrichaceae bacterium]|uniref:Anti-sigma-K factor RskA n=1 Tax=uncultured Thiotrichaceae bacterium TaxID=298394 RepID=A0A6S6UJQ6_9GAMM|nr:MAG: Anti-sigma-K factor RskA [uncultured Thiotrichaceae bacterium]
MNRYQKPELYERLAMEYSLGTLKGQARSRFEKLMDIHPFIRVAVDEFDAKFAVLAEQVPEVKPPESVWKNIEANISAKQTVVSTPEKKPFSLLTFFTQKGYALAGIMVLISALFIFGNPEFSSDSPVMFTSTLVSSNDEPMAEVVAMKSEMKMRIKLKEEIAVPEGKTLTFWCMPKDPSKPAMNMGTLVSTGSNEMELTKQIWLGLIDAREFVISFEPSNANNLSPTDNLYTGKIEALTRT